MHNVRQSKGNGAACVLPRKTDDQGLSMTRFLRLVFRPLTACSPLLALLATGCREKSMSYYEVPHEEHASSASLSAPMMGDMPPGTPGASVTGPAQPAGAQLEWDKPAAWSEQPPSQMRRASYAFVAPNGDKADVSVFVFPDAAGGLLANLNRWRGQVGLAPVAETDLETTATKTEIAGQTAWRVDIAGTPASGGGTTRILGAIVPVSGSAWFFKAMGPDAVVASQRDAFNHMISSIRAVTPSAEAATGAAPAAPLPPDAAMPNDATHAGIGGGAVASSGLPGMPGMVGDVPPPSAAGFSFTAPEGWQAQPTTPFRVVNFAIPGPGVPAAEFYVTPLGGMAGGELANVNRWRGQLGLAPVAEADLAGLSTTVTGPAGTFTVFDIASTGPALKTGERARMLAAILVRGDTSWFFRLTGEINHVASLRPAFDTFLKSVSFEAAP